MFDLESGIGSGNPPCGFDYMEIFDGADTNANSLVVFCNGNMPPASLNSSGGSLTIHFHTDPGEHLQGFQINWQCNNSTSSATIEKPDIINNVNIFPNPSNSLVNIEVILTEQIPVDITLIDMVGKIHYKLKSQQTGLTFKEALDVSNLSTGAYVIYINNKAYRFNKN